MVSGTVARMIAFVLILSHAAHAVVPALSLHWVGNKDKPCQKLIECFLGELRSLATDRQIELEAAPAGAADSGPVRTMNVRCVNGSVEVADAASQGEPSPDEPILLHYSQKAAGFEASDWLPFQRKYLRPELSILRPSESESSSFAPTAHAAPMATPLGASHASARTGDGTPLLQRWWFWALVGGVGAGIYLATRSSSGHSGMQVEIQ